MGNSLKIALFGEAEKGDYQKPHYCTNLKDLMESLGHPPSNSQGLYYAIQALLYHRLLFFIRVREEGFSQQDYFMGLHFLKNHQLSAEISAICLPGAGDRDIINAVIPFCHETKSVLILTLPDLYDYVLDQKLN